MGGRLAEAVVLPAGYKAHEDELQATGQEGNP
jgi:hypothetical protein